MKTKNGLPFQILVLNLLLIWSVLLGSPLESKAQGEIAQVYEDVYLTPGTPETRKASFYSLIKDQYYGFYLLRSDGNPLSFMILEIKARSATSCSFQIELTANTFQNPPYVQQIFTTPLWEWAPITQVKLFGNWDSAIVKISVVQDCDSGGGDVEVSFLLTAEGQPITDTPERPTSTQYPTSTIPTRSPTREPPTPTWIPTPSSTLFPTSTSPPPLLTSTIPIPPQPTSTSIPPAETPIVSVPVSPLLPPTLEIEKKVLVVTNSNWLDRVVGDGAWQVVQRYLPVRYGQTGYEVLDLGIKYAGDNLPPDEYVTKLEIDAVWDRVKYWGIFILGGSAVVPHARIPGVVIDGITSLSDDYYSDFNGDWIPDTILARLADGGSLDLLRRQLGLEVVSQGQCENLIYTERYTLYGKEFDQEVLKSLGCIGYFGLGGVSPQNSTWGVLRPGKFEATFVVQGVPPQPPKVVISEASFGANYCRLPLCWESTSNSIAMAFLKNGTDAFIGNINQSYHIREASVSPKDPPSQHPGIPKFADTFVGNWQIGKNPFLAFLRAKQESLAMPYGMHPDVERRWRNTIQGLVIYGVPTRPDPAGKTCPSGDWRDCDGDFLLDTVEEQLAETFNPYLMVDHHEYDQPESRQYLNQVRFYWQASPAQLVSEDKSQGITTRHGIKGVMLTIVAAWPWDFGPYDWSPADKRSEITCRSADLGVDFQATGRHCGDTEGLRIFLQFKDGSSLESVNENYDPSNWKLTHIDWKRHSEGFGDPVEAANVTFSGTHPVIYVSGWKHAMYPDPVSCNKYTHSEGSVKVSGYLCFLYPYLCLPSKVLEATGQEMHGCKIYLDVCEQPYYQILASLKPDHNVGEHSPGYAILYDLAVDEYPGENAWAEQPFCGAQPENRCQKNKEKWDVHGEICSGAMKNMWYLFNEVPVLP